MKNKVFIILFLILSVLLVSPVNSYATNTTYNLAKNKNVTNYVDNYNKDQNCNGLLGSPSNPNSVAWLIQTILNYLRVIGPILVLVLSSIDFTKVIIESDDDAMAKAKKKLIQRLVLAVLLFFVPTIVKVLLNIFGITSDPTCSIS